MNTYRRKSTKIDLSVKLLALDMYKKGDRLSLISKTLGYSEPTVKYWLTHSESILAKKSSESNKTPCNGDNVYSELYNDEKVPLKRLLNDSHISNDHQDNHAIRARLNSSEPTAKRRLLDYPQNCVSNSNSPPSTKETETMFNTSPRVLEYHSTSIEVANQMNNFLYNQNENDFRNFKQDVTNCQETIEELVDFISSGKKLLNKASNFLYQLQDTMNEYEIRKKVKLEFQ